MNWLVYVLVSLVFYSLMPPLLKTVMKEIPSNIALVVTNSILCSLTFVVAKVQGYSFSEHLSLDRNSLILYTAGVVLAVSMISYYKAIEMGPISSVVPIYGMYVALTSIISFLVLGEKLTLTKGVGLIFALIAIILLSR